MVPGVDHDLRLRTELQAVGVGGAPVRHVGRVERRLEELVLQQHPLLVPEPLVDLGERLGQPVLPLTDVVLAGIVRTVREPQLQVPGPGRVHDVDALQQMIDRLAADRRLRVADAAQLVVVVLEGVGVDGAQLHATLLGVLREGRVVLDLVPGDVQRHGRGHPGELVDLPGVVQLLPGIARNTLLGEHLEARSRVPVRPRRRLDGLCFEGGLHRGELGHVRAPTDFDV